MQVLELNISDSTVERLHGIRRLLGLRTSRELFQNALVILCWIASEKQEGRAIVSVDRKTGAHKELTLPSLKRAAKNPIFDLQIDHSFTELKAEFNGALK
jgi:hypothetical protein